MIGGLLMLLGLITFWPPLPVGVPSMLLGAPWLLRRSPHARTWRSGLRGRGEGRR